MAVRSVPAFALLLVLAVPLPGEAARDDLATCATRDRVEFLPDGWIRIDAPTDAPIVDFAVPAGVTGRIYATDGYKVKNSGDGGCTWDHIHPIPGQEPLIGVESVDLLAAPGGNELWMATHDDAGGGMPRPHVYATGDARHQNNGATEPFVARDAGLPAVGRPVALAVPAGDRERAYLLVEHPTNGSRRLYRYGSDDRVTGLGAPEVHRWTEVYVPPAVTGLAGLAVSPLDRDTIWVWFGTAYARSDNGGASWSDAGSAPETIATVDVNEQGVASVVSGRLMRFTEDAESAELVREQAAPVVPLSLAHGSKPGVYALSSASGTYGYDVVTRRWVGLGPRDVPPLAGLRFAASGTRRILLGRTQDALYRRALCRPERFLCAGEKPLPPDEGETDSGLTGAHLNVSATSVTVAPGQVVRDPGEFAVGPDPRRIDVFFLVDTTQSMASAIDGLKSGIRWIAAELEKRTGGQACFGLGEVRDDGVNSSTVEDPFVYRLRLPITCSLPWLVAALQPLEEGGGSLPYEEAITVGLTQAVTGEGSRTPFVPAGQQAGFQAPNRAIVLVSDAGFHIKPGFPTIDDTVGKLREYGGVKVVSLHVDTGNPGGTARPVKDMTALAVGTASLAPEGGVDCGPGAEPLEAGDPLVCSVGNVSASVAPAITGLLLGVPDLGPVAVRVGDPHRVVASVDGPLEKGVNLRRESRLPFTLGLTCSPAQDGKDLPVTLTGTVRGAARDQLRVVVRCRGPRAQVVRDPEPESLGPPERPRPVPPLVPVPQFQPPAPNNPVSNINPNTGMSQQEDEQYQVATATQAAAEQDEDEILLAMSLLAGAVLGGLAMSRRRQAVGLGR